MDCQLSDRAAVDERSTARMRWAHAAEWLRRALVAAQGWALPPRCVLCLDPGRPPTLDLCPACEAELPRVEHACDRCAAPRAGPLATCGRCAQAPPPFARAFAPFAYDWPLADVVRGFKYGKQLPYGRVLGELLAEHLLARGPPWPEALVPVPLHPRRERARGYNQAWEIARVIGARLRLRVEPLACVRVRDTSPQAALDARARAENLRGAFALPAPVGCRHVAIVDDVFTTGATLAEITRVLQAGGVERVEAWAVARA
jgi:ComF family protein